MKYEKIDLLNLEEKILPKFESLKDLTCLTFEINLFQAEVYVFDML